MNQNDERWQKLAAAARKSKPVEPVPTVPGDFARRVVGLKATIIAISRTLFWRRWSAWIAMLCALALLVIFLLLRATRPETPLIETPQPPPTPATSR
jgi:hypothetical protein